MLNQELKAEFLSTILDLAIGDALEYPAKLLSLWKGHKEIWINWYYAKRL